ncbi:hypothetical protein [Saccharibacillus sacchari]|uniref:Uncharacterized protein n=1 Tax=Saccharibacillus sacchari TaxID=456493 RepID=A0ACC6P7Y1_9BACL
MNSNPILNEANRKEPLLPKWKPGDTIRLIAPARSFSIVGAESREWAESRLAEWGLRVTYGKHAEECDDFGSTSVGRGNVRLILEDV